MFVDIEDYKSPLKVEIILTPYKRGRLAPDKKTYLPKEPITPDICWEVLRSTNAPRNIKDMLQCIADLPSFEQARFKDIVLSTFTQREQPNTQPHNIVLLGRKLAQASGYEAELVEAQKIKKGLFLSSAPYVDKSFVTFGNTFCNNDFSAYDRVVFLTSEKIQFYDSVKFSKKLELLNSSNVDLSGCDLNGVQSISFKDGAVINLSHAENIPPNLDFSHCSDVKLSHCDLSNQPNLSFKDGAIVDLNGAQNLPHNLDFSHCSEVDLSGCDLSGQLNLRFNDGAIVDLDGAQNLPPQLDFSHCSEVDLSGCDLSGQPNLAFKDGAIADLHGAQNLPPQLDFSHCSEVDLSGCDLSGQLNLAFKDEAIVDLTGAQNLPHNLDFSRCRIVRLADCDLSNQHNLSFKDGYIVNLQGAQNLPPQLDFSRCRLVRLNDCDLANVKRLVFKNRKQMEKSDAKIPDDWKGKLVFDDEQQEASLNLANALNTKGGR